MTDKQEREVPGYEIDCHTSLSQKIFWAGVPRGILITELVIALFGGIIFKTFTVPVMMFCLHVVIAFVTSKDPFAIDKWLDSRHYKTYYYR